MRDLEICNIYIILRKFVEKVFPIATSNFIISNIVILAPICPIDLYRQLTSHMSVNILTLQTIFLAVAPCRNS